MWKAAKGLPTNVSFDVPALKGATNVVRPGVDHRETSFSPAAFAATYAFITGRTQQVQPIAESNSVMLSGTLVGLGLNPLDAASGNYVNNLPLPDAQLAVFETGTATGARKGSATYAKQVSANGQ